MSIPGGSNPLLLASAGGAGGGYEIERSLRFNSSDSAYCSRVPSTAGNRKTWTWAGWVKRCEIFNQRIFTAGSDGNNHSLIEFTGTNNSQLEVRNYISAYKTLVTTSALFRDPSAWYHIVVSCTSSSLKIYVNGTETAYSSVTGPDGSDWFFNSTVSHTIGRSAWGSEYFGGYLADIHFIDGQALTPSSFGEFSATTGVWVPKQYTGTYGSQGWHLDFSDNSTAAALGTDTSGAGNTWTVNNISVAGSKNYADYLTRFTPGENKYSAFDGSTSTNVSQDLADGTGITFTPSPSISVTSQLRFYHTTGAPSTKEYIINGGSAVTTPNSGWVTTSFTGTLTSFVLRDNRGVGYSAALYAIEVDGSVLVDYRAVTGNDSLVDVPVNGSEVDTGSGGQVRGNYATWNPLIAVDNRTLSNGNLDYSVGGSNTFRVTTTTIAVSSGKYYCEVSNFAGGAFGNLGIVAGDLSSQELNQDRIQDKSNVQAKGYVLFEPVNNYYRIDGGSSVSYTIGQPGSGDVLGFALDMTAKTCQLYKNGTALGSVSFSSSALANKAVYFITNEYSGGSGSFNAGARPFAYTAPSGFKALCTANLPAPVVTKPSTVFDVKLYTGNGSTQTITTGFSPDLVWIKNRSQAIPNCLTDSVRGVSRQLVSDMTTQENLFSGYGVTAFNSDGFTLVDLNDGSYRVNGVPGSAYGGSYAAWCWDAGSSTVTNTQGSISSQVRANASAGFSVVTFTGTGSTGTIGHGLGVAPSVYLVKKRSGTSDWAWFTTAIDGSVDFLFLNSTAAKTDAGGGYATAPTSSVFSLGDASSSINDNGGTYVAYCFAPVAGYSSFGSYTGNGSTDGPFVFCGFRPRFLILKQTNTTRDWLVYDSARDDYNAAYKYLYPNLSNAEGTNPATLPIDFLSNGFKIRASNATANASAGTYIYFAVAESPFQYARAR